MTSLAPKHSVLWLSIFGYSSLIAANAFGSGMGLPSLITYQNRGKVRNKGHEVPFGEAVCHGFSFSSNTV
jgi:hypothetical protein